MTMEMKLLDQMAVFDIKCDREGLVKASISGFPAVPETPNTRTENNGDELYWIGKKNFLFRTILYGEKMWQKTLQEYEKNGHFAQALVSDIYVFFEFKGTGVHDYLARITSLDLDKLNTTNVCFSQALGLKMLFIKREIGFELAFENCYKEMVLEQFHQYLE
ncbi:MAG: hypothetical protein F4223_05320 [Rhodobacteraceae bacterium]|nr:hypothetical protein [Paracoccaceae bacterium]